MLAEFLAKHKSEKGKSSTHTSLPPNAGKYIIKDDEYDEFLGLYYEEFKKGTKMYYTEQHCEFGPLLIDLDFKFPMEIGLQRKYSNDLIKRIIMLWNNEIGKYIDIAKDEIYAYVFEKSKPVSSKGYIKDGVHIMYPNVVTIPEVQIEIRNIIIKELEEQKMFDDLGVLNTVNEIVDEAVISKSGWFMYGSTKENSEYYKITHVYNYDCDECDLPEENCDLIRKLSIRNKKRCCNSTIIKKKKESDVKIITYEDIDKARKYVTLLSKERSDDRQKWIDLGICLYNIDNSLLESWIDFSKQSDKFISGECEKKWNSFRKNNDKKKLTIASLIYWASIDNPEEFKNMKKDETLSLLTKSLEGTHFQFAVFLHAKYQHQYVCSNVKNGNWYHYKNHRWEKMDKASELMTKMSTEIAGEFMELSKFYNEKAMTEHEKESEYLENAQKADKCWHMLKKRPEKEQILKECCDLFKKEGFEAELDSKLNLLGFKNGVYDLEKKEFRDGVPDDMISLSTNLEYEEFNPNLVESQEISTFLKQILPDGELRGYVMKLVSMCLSGLTGEQKFHIWTGKGSNGKSRFIELIEESLGDYARKCPVTLLTKSRAASNAASPELSNLPGKRFLSFQEPESGEKLNLGLMKELSGGDKIMARPLYSNPFEFKPQFKMVLCCNDLPHIPGDDDGTWRRIRVVYFPSKFTDNPKESNEYQKDIHLPEKMKNWKQQFIAMLLETYKKYIREGLKEPDCVLEHTKEYERKSDSFADFVYDKLEQTKNKKDTVSLTSLYPIYKVWYSESFSEKPPSKNDFKANMEKRYGKILIGKGWEGLKLKDCEESEEIDTSIT